MQVLNNYKVQFGRRKTVATGNTKADKGSSARNAGEHSYQKRGNQSGERGGFRNTEGKSYHKPKEGAKPYRPRFDKDKDEEESRFRKGGKSNDRRNSRSQVSKETAKIKEQQPDKMDIVKRLEKEKKAMQKKNNQNSQKSKGNAGRVQRPVKRSNNIDWTREYENDSYDDDDMSYMY